MKRRRQLAIEISPSRVELAQLRSGAPRPLRSERLCFDPEMEWTERLETVGRRLKEWIDELDLAGSRTTVLYDSPLGHASVFSCPQSAGRSSAAQAARLAIAERVSLPSEDCASTTVALPGAGSGEGAQRHLLLIGDAQANVELVADLVENLGLSFANCLPFDAPVIAWCAGEVARSSRQGPALLAHIGEHSTVMCAAVEGRLLFARRVGIGTESFVEALSGAPIPTSNGGSVSLTVEEARALLGRAGAPEPDEEIDPARGILGSGVMPLIRPALQRMVVEVRQSIRFGLSEEERASARLSLAGHGSHAPGLGEAIAHECKLTFERASAPTGLDAPSAEVGPLSALASWAGAPAQDLAPARVRQERTLRRVRNGLWAGAGVAAGFVALSWLGADAGLREARDRLDALERELTSSDEAASTARTLAATRRGLTHAEGRIMEEFGEAIDAPAVLSAVAQVTPASVQLSDLSLGESSEGPTLSLRGSAMSQGGADATTQVRSYLDALASLPVVETCRLGSTRRQIIQGRDATSFEITVGLRGGPARSLPAVASALSLSEEDSP